MPQQPKISSDVQVDSWSIEVTNELNDLRRKITKAKNSAAALNPATATIEDIIEILEDL